MVKKIIQEKKSVKKIIIKEDISKDRIKFQAKFLRSIVENLINKQAVPIIDLLIEKTNVNEFLIAKKLNLTINQTRNILYKMSDFGLVSFIRKKDKRKGWYIYFWTLNTYHSLNLFLENLQGELSLLEAQIKSRKERRFYNCKTCNIEVSEEVALMNDFVCTECEQIYTLSESPEIIMQLQKNIDRIMKEIELVSSEISIEGEKIEKKKSGKIKRQEKEVKALREKKRADKKKLNQKLNKSLKKTESKNVIKKSIKNKTKKGKK